MNYIPGQRWLSTAEPELGLGRIDYMDDRMVHVSFPAAEEERMYAAENAPLQRLIFREGDTIGDGEKTGVVTEIMEHDDDTVTYRLDDGSVLAESGIQADAGLHGPEDRMRSGLFDDNNHFELRAEAWQRRHALRKHAAWGFSGARMSLIPPPASHCGPCPHAARTSCTVGG